ncbi:MAG: O-antigen ligase family protein [Burkholderiaceae bacterium]
MATKKKRNASGARAKVETRPEAAVSAAAEAPAAPASPTGARPATGPVARDATPAARPGAVSLPAEVVRDDWTVIILALMMFLAPAVGVPHEEMLQDTLKSIVVAFAALGAGLMFFWHQRNRRDALRWHALVWLPLALMFYAIGSMAWSHAYLGGVEAIRWFILGLLLWLGLNTLSRERLPWLFWGIHCGVLVASLWTALQFWTDFRYFPQGPNPASTFVNRNFFAEFVVCTLPFSTLLILRAKASALIALLAFTTAFNLVAMMMTGTRSALLALLAMLLVLPVILYRYRKLFAFSSWGAGSRILLFGVLLGTTLGLGLINTNNPKIIEEHRLEQRGMNALERAFARSKSMTQTEEYTQRSFSVRLVMWKATARIIQARPFSGVGAGAWEVDIPLYQAEGSQLETDYYVHNEILQLLAEYGLVGWLFLLCLLGYLTQAAWKTLRAATPDEQAEAPLRAITLLAMLMFLIVSNAGFPWRMASTGALFALMLAILGASDARLGYRGAMAGIRLPWKPAYSQVGAVVMMICLALAAYVSQQAAESESKIVRAVKLALSISQSGDYHNPRWDKTKREMLNLIQEGIELNPHYRKITPMVADELAKWGDWRNAVWIWESVLGSRPYVVAIMSNVARGYAQMGQNDKALEYLKRAKELQPKATSVNSLEVILLSRSGKEAQALKQTRELVASGNFDFDLINAAYVLGARAKDWPFAIKALELRSERWPEQKADGLIKLGHLYASVPDIRDDDKALASYKAALAAAPEANRAAVRAQIPPAYQARL